MISKMSDFAKAISRSRTGYFGRAVADGGRIAGELDKILDGFGPRKSAIARAAAALHLSTRQVFSLHAVVPIGR
jgi:hypothetical protein